MRQMFIKPNNVSVIREILARKKNKFNLKHGFQY